MLKEEMLSAALDQLRSALQLLDLAAAPAHIGAHVDLAIHELYIAAAEGLAGRGLNAGDRAARPQ